MYIMGENPVLTDPDSHHVREALSKLDFFVFQDMFLNETAEYAHVILPACSYAEKDGTFTNTERRVQRVRKAIEPIGESRDDCWIICEIARRMGAKGFEYTRCRAKSWMKSPALRPSMGGINYKRLDEGSLQWPCPSEDHPGTCILHEAIFCPAFRQGQLRGAEIPPARRNDRCRLPAHADDRPPAIPLSRHHDPESGGAEYPDERRRVPDKSHGRRVAGYQAGRYGAGYFPRRRS